MGKKNYGEPQMEISHNRFIRRVTLEMIAAASE
jgi:hypothetical protein